MTTEASAEFAVSLLKQNNKEESFVFSPFSLGTALSIVHYGAAGYTKKEMTGVLMNGCKDEEVAKHYSGLIHVLAASNPAEITIEVANKFFLRNEMDLKQEYQKSMVKLYDAEVEKYDFNDTAGAVKAVNGYCDEKTHGKISEVVQADMFTADTMAVLINAVYFKGMWDKPFEKNATREDDFHGVNGDRKEMFMYQGEKQVLLNFNHKDVQVIAIPYKDSAYKMWFFLPREGLPLKEWIDSLTGAQLVDLMKDAHSDKCNVKLPRFKIETNMPAKENLMSIGLEHMFTDSADLSGISDTPLKVDDVIHKAVIEINEEGAEAAAVTAIEFTLECYVQVPDFEADRAFAYVISYQDDLLFFGSWH